MGTARNERQGSTRRAKRAAAGSQQRRVSRPEPTARAPVRPSRRLLAIGILLLLAVAAGVGWQIHRRAQAPPVAAGGMGGAADAREAALLGAVQTHPSESKARRALAEYFLEHQAPFEALWELAMARELGAVDEVLTLHTAEALKRGGLPEWAIRLLSMAHVDFHGQPSLDQALAQTELQVADPAAAAQVIRSNPALAAAPEGLLLLARADLALGDLPAARADWKRARQAAGRRGWRQTKDERRETRNERATTTDRALSTIGSRLSSASSPDTLALGRLALAWGDGATAREELAAAARAEPGSEEAQYYAGLAYSASGRAADTARAVEYFKAATRADPHQARAGVALGRLLYEKPGQWEQAAEVYRQALSMDPRCVAAEEGLARVRTALKQPGEAVYHQARVRDLKSRPEEALPLYRRWGELRPERWDSVLRAAECSMGLQRYMDAVREVQRGLRRYPANPELFGHLAQLYLRTNSLPEAARVCDQWAPVDRTSGRPEWLRGQLATKALRDADALHWFEMAVAKNADLGAYHASLGEQLASQSSPERLKRARAELERAVALDSGMAVYQYQLGLVLQKTGDVEGARQAFLRALDRDGDRLDAYAGVMATARRAGRPGIAAFFAGLERAVRDRKRDEAAARLALSARPGDAGAHLRLARLLLRRADLAGARDHLEIAAEKPDGAPARPLLRRVERLLSVL